jgi:methyl-accepting chemotaxis protein
VTLEKARKAANDAKVAADSGIAIIDFTTNGEIITANEVFLRATGYSLTEIQGRHHRMFVTADHAKSDEYASFWQRLNAGHPIAGDFQRVGKGGKEVALQASYTPVFDGDGHVIKITKMATDVTPRVQAVKIIALALEELASNNLSHRIDEALDPAYTQLQANYNKAAEQLESAIQGIVANTGAIRSGTDELAQAADDLSQRTERQAASLEETAAALEEITATVARSSSAAKQADHAVQQARAKAQESSVVVRDTVSAMGSIEESAKQISQIIGVIDEIAFQTNLLALNAGVEAARAGDAGRGFAVVASEVRSLAQRSAEAAKEIKTLITTSVRQVERGVELVGETGRALQAIVDRVSDVHAVVSDIAVASGEQATGIAEVNTAVGQMDQVTQQNAAMVEESTAATHALVQEIEELDKLAASFQLTGGSAAVKPVAARQGVAKRTGRMPIGGKVVGRIAGGRSVSVKASSSSHPKPTAVAAGSAPRASVAAAHGATAVAEDWTEF